MTQQIQRIGHFEDGMDEDANGAYVRYEDHVMALLPLQSAFAFCVEHHKRQVDYKKLYLDLLMQVVKVQDGESRHDTAKRYIIERENIPGGTLTADL